MPNQRPHRTARAHRLWETKSVYKAEGKTQHKLFFTQLINYSQSLNTQQKHISAGAFLQLSDCSCSHSFSLTRPASRCSVFKDNCESAGCRSTFRRGEVLRASGWLRLGILKFSNKFIASPRGVCFCMEIRRRATHTKLCKK